MTDECKAIINFLNCDYELLSNEEEKIISRFNELTAQGKEDGFYPLIIIPSDTLAETLALFNEDNDIEEDTPEGITAYRQTVIEASNEIDAPAFLSARLDEYLDYNEGYDIFGQFEQSEPQNDLTFYMLANGSCTEVIIAKIPAKNPWEIAAWIPMGGFNECPTPNEQAAVFRYWYEKYGAVPAVVTLDIWQMKLTKPPITDEEAEALAKEHFAFCCDIVTQGCETIRRLASVLRSSAAWYFWWD